MLGNPLLLLATIVWIVMAVLNLQQQPAKGEYLVGMAMFHFITLGIFALLSLLMTINLASSGGFDWISENRGTRNLMVGAGWLCMMGGIAFCVLANPGRPATSLLEKILSYGVLWMPLLMLAPCAILSNPAWKAGVSPMAYTLPLAAGSLIGLALLLAPRIIASAQHRKIAQELIDADFQNTMKTIEQETKLAQLLTIAENYSDARFRAAATARIKAFPALEDSLMSLLRQAELTDAHWAYVYMSKNSIEHPDRFLKPVQDNLAALALAYTKKMKEPDSYDYTIYYTNVETICKALDAQMGAQRAELKPALKGLLDALGTPIPDDKNAPDGLMERRNKYKKVLEAWLNK